MSTIAELLRDDYLNNTIEDDEIARYARSSNVPDSGHYTVYLFDDESALKLHDNGILELL